MRLRVVVPRGRRGTGLGRLTRRAALLAALILLLAGCGADDSPEREAASPPQAASPAQDAPALVTGLTEQNARLLASPPAGGPLDPAVAAWRERIAALRPRYVRVLVDWAKLQPAAGAPPSFAAAVDGCQRGVAPCAPYAGLGDRLRAIQALGARPVLVLYGTPAWAARPPAGCERAGTEPRARAPRAEPYRAFVRAVAAFVAQRGVESALWSPWNEPNHPAFLNPQRSSCDEAAAARSPALYAELARALRAELPEASIVLGEAAGYGEPRDSALSAAELAAALPRDVACAGEVWAQHAYVGSPSQRQEGSAREGRGGAPLAGDPGRAGSLPLVDAVLGALDAHRCEREHRVWITETGVAGEERRTVEGCREMAAALGAWAEHPRVDAAFQYTAREDPLFRTGLTSPELGDPYPVYAAWRAWGGRPAGAPPPRTPCA